ncbi:glycoside hydrolase family 108 protein [Hyphomonas sp.]|jgi:lysozyme family protein|uniref:glycoside hydrolase family 108 protein n=1 Tax=Hyphomonas sp. TaxID=87 RepID=UPI0037C0C5A9
MADKKTAGSFGAPKRSTRWVKAAIIGADAPAGVIESDAAYVSLDLIDLGLARPGLLTSKYHALFLSDLSAVTQVQTKLRQSALIDPRKVRDGIETKNAGNQDLGVTSICAQMPWHGGIDGEFVVLALRSEALLATLLDLNDRLSASLPKMGGQPPPGESEDDDGEGHESLLATAAGAITGKLASTFVKKIGYTAAVEIARILKAQDGTYTTRLRVPVSASLTLQPGYYVMLPDAQANGEVELDFSGGRLVPALRIRGKSVRGRDYAVIRVTATERHQNIEDVPAVGDAWVSLQRVLESGGQPDEALNAFRRVVAISPYLIRADRQRLQQQAADMVETVRPYLVGKGAGDHESLRESPLARLAFRTLKDAWNSGALDNLPGAIRKTLSGRTEAARTTQPSVPAAPAQKADPAPVAPAAPPPPPPPADRFETALKFCFKWEGGYSDHASDRGGKTNYGVTEQVFHEWLDSRGEPLRPVKEITHDEVRAIYWSEYWLSARCDRLKRQLDLLMFDASVNHGPGGAARLLQRALNALGETLKVDGAIGGQTFAAIARYETKALAAQYLEERRALFHRIVARDASQSVFLKGWLNRVKDLENATGEGGTHSDFETVPVEITSENTPFAAYVD